jgi:hypothetical protein
MYVRQIDYASTSLEKFCRARQQFPRSSWVWMSGHPQPDAIVDQIVAPLSAILQLVALSGMPPGAAP